MLDLKRAREVVLSRIATLTPRERQVFELIIRGNSNKAVANQLGSTVRTIKAHRHRLMEKMQLRSQRNLFPLLNRSASSPMTSSPPNIA